MLAFKIMDDPFVGSLTFCRIYSGKLESGSTAPQFAARSPRAGRPHAAHACQPPRGHQGSLCRRHHRARRPQGSRAPATRSATCRSRSSSRRWNSPIRSSRSRSSRRPRATRRSSASRCRGWRPRTRRSASRPIRRAARPSSRAWASCISTSRSTSSSAPTRSTSNVGAAAGRLSRDDHAAGHPRLYPQEADRRLGPVRPVSSSRSRRAAPARATISRPRSSAARCRRNTFPASRRASSRC